MTEERTAPLRQRDPRTLGPYELIARLGEGGMGTVYLARSADGDLVAVKMIRADLAPDDEFRRRFRSEVNRVRQVPPFCTAEVLDADPDHESPYLVVEYVDGPSLAEVVEKRGPLKSSNLHSVAIGVATALTAIHGAGVIHRDLKPRNVLLAPGSPKVIDFGIARALESTSAHTRTDQMVGTVAYMAPERFDLAGTPITPAADVFAWGAVVAYAGMGRTPFSADSATATATRILTQPPDLSGLSGSLRDLVAHALEKDPANRPTARELLDLLVAGPHRPAATAAALAHQPGLRAAAQEAQAVTGHHEAPHITALGPGPALVGYDEESIVTQPVTAPPAIVFDPPPAEPPGRRRWALPAAVALLIASVVAGIAMVGAAWPADGETATTDPSFAPPSTPADPDGPVLVSDPLVSARLWQESAVPAEHAGCSFDGGLVVERATRGSFRCVGPQDAEPNDLQTEVRLRLLTKNSCAAIWFRFRPYEGYQVRVCQQNIYVGTHKNADVVTFKTFPLDDDPIGLDVPTTISLTIRGSSVEIVRGGELVGQVPLDDPDITVGRVVLGIFTERNAPEQGPYSVVFNDVKIWRIV
ncbi:MAG: eukaryotic-like serine/threonine-protein kinase [Actinoplanes sp.]|nr:eukaryotic-like serine/threonine-protein kinase [Actinoplanes sp.]